MTQAQKLQKLVDQIDHLLGCKVERKAQSYYVRGDWPTLYFQTFSKGEWWLKEWIRIGRQPSLASLTWKPNQRAIRYGRVR